MSKELIERLEIDHTWTLFLDRDGVINQETFENYITVPEDFKFLKGSQEALRKLAFIFSRIIIVTNQQGVGKGLMSEEDLRAVNEYMIIQIEESGGRIDAVYCATELRNTPNGLRKPGRKMADLAKGNFPEIDFNKSIMVGNSNSDIEFGENLGMITVFIGEEHSKSKIVVPNLFAFGELFK